MKAQEHRNELLTGVGFVLLGAFLFINQFVSVDISGDWFLLLIALGFTVWGIFTRTPGLLIPAGVFLGISLGVAAIESPLGAAAGDRDGGLFLIGFSLGWASITLTTALFTQKTFWWALIPAGLLATIGVGVLTEGVLLDIVAIAGKAWPVIFIILGFIVLFERPSKVTH